MRLAEQKLDMRDLYEYQWLLHTLGSPSTLSVEVIDEESPAPSDCPIVVVQRPHGAAIAKILRKWMHRVRSSLCSI